MTTIEIAGELKARRISLRQVAEQEGVTAAAVGRQLRSAEPLPRAVETAVLNMIAEYDAVEDVKALRRAAQVMAGVGERGLAEGILRVAAVRERRFDHGRVGTTAVEINRGEGTEKPSPIIEGAEDRARHLYPFR